MSDPAQFAKVDGKLAPVDPIGRELVAKMGDGEIVVATIRRLRNPAFHRKFFALLRVAYDQWKPAQAKLHGMPAAKSFETFRKELIVASGYYDVVLGLDGQARLEAQSIAWGNMGEEVFTELYEAVVAVLSQGVMPGLTPEAADHLAAQVIAEGF